MVSESTNRISTQKTSLQKKGARDECVESVPLLFICRDNEANQEKTGRRSVTFFSESKNSSSPPLLYGILVLMIAFRKSF